MKKHILIFLSLIFIVIASACSGGEDKDRSHSPAAIRGQEDAAALCTDSVKLSPHALTAAILSVRSREWKMRSAGFDDDADAYIEAFKEYITEHNHALAQELF